MKKCLMGLLAMMLILTSLPALTDEALSFDPYEIMGRTDLDIIDAPNKPCVISADDV